MSVANINVNNVPNDVDIFESVVMQEESSVKAGYLAGLNHGTEKGQEDGYQLGHSLGCSVGNEIGFLQGFVSTWLALLDQSPDTKEKTSKALTSLQTLLGKYPLGTVNSTCVTDLKMIQARFKKVVSLLGINISWSHTASKQESLSF
ncbi:protein LTO1 homolog [Octopus bimaculoides]|uniref:Essential protein Yae1 N-terminal domain-containing protein n=1 Tax=Octopus bimaculoides TaxID=37653 RepID=A0A0L8H0D1_OCTBM|nr:protein LTO1 homolog [Octopus bimaculoides]|eukprot:XP_014776480.1 PREDICTED: oral cancer-overexpressed protein 1-like [Octopus bimaculoides]